MKNNFKKNGQMRVRFETPEERSEIIRILEEQRGFRFSDELKRQTDIHKYDRLEQMPDAKEMFDAICTKYKSRCEILTDVPKPGRGIITAGPDKTEWARRERSPKVKANIVLRKEKIRYCKGPESILSDDYEKNIREWQAVGGIAILHISTKSTLEQLKTLGIL